VGVRHLSRDIASLLADARATIARLSPEDAYAAQQDGALLVDVRSAVEQREQGVLITAAAHHPLSVVLWRLDSLPRETRVVLLCRHGYSSSLAAAQLAELGFDRPGDVAGGVEAWVAAGLPVERVAASAPPG
jgi:rhodanese-related sulfurtransferase